jgi:hypothetical protein
MARLLLIFLSLYTVTVFGQISPEKLAAGRMDKNKWQKTGQSLRKAISKDSASAETHYLMSLFFFTAHNPAFNIDSAHRYVITARRTYATSTAKDRDRMKRVPLDSGYLVRLARGIDSAAFERAKQINTAPGYQSFLDRYPQALQTRSVIELRDEVAFLDALKSNSWKAYEEYMALYPASRRNTEAMERYERLLYEDKTKDGRLSTFIKFHQQYPKNRYRAEAEKNIFEISTATGAPSSFQWFLRYYPSGKFASRARNILYKLQLPDEDTSDDKQWMTDSLREAERMSAQYWVPVIKSGLFGFIDGDGKEVMPPKYTSVSDEYRCGDVSDNALITSAGLVARSGKVIVNSKVLSADLLGSGFIVVTSDSGKHVVHESGFKIGGGRVDGAQILAGHFVALQKNNKWSVYSFSGKQLLPFAYEGVASIDSIVLLVKNGKKILSTPYRVTAPLRQTDFKEDFVFDDIRRWGDGQYWVRNGALEGVIDVNLKFVIPLDRQSLRKTSFGFLRGKEDKFFIKGLPKVENVAYKSVREQGGWVAMQTLNDRHLMYDRTLGRLEEGDSAWFRGRLAFLMTGDSVKAFLPSGQRMMFQKGAPFRIVEFTDSSAWLVLDDKKGKAVVDAASGIRLFTMQFDQIDAVAHDLFIVTRAGKKGMVDEDGKLLVPMEYDAIVALEKSSFSLLKDKKFGWYDVRSKGLIKPMFDRNIKPYNQKLHTAFKDGAYGFILPDGKALGTFNWEEIQYWNDSLAWGKKNFQWILFDIYTQARKLDRVRNFDVIKDTPAEKIYRVRQDNAFGVISNHRGVVVPLQYSDIVNLGNRDIPLYFTERHIEEAGISVVVYYDQHGKIVRRQALETEEFEKIYCDN